MNTPRGANPRAHATIRDVRIDPQQETRPLPAESRPDAGLRFQSAGWLI